MCWRNDWGHWLIDSEKGGIGESDLYDLIGVEFDVVDDVVDFCEKIRKIADHLLRVGFQVYHIVGWCYSKNYLFLETIS